MDDNINLAQNNLTTCNYFAEKFRKELSNCIILHINHELVNVFALNNIIHNLTNVELVFIAVPYSENSYVPKTDYTIISSRRIQGKYRSYKNEEEIKGIPKSADFVKNLQNQIEYVLNTIIRPKLKKKKLIILQDGGYTATFNKDILSELHNFVGLVEQTQSGTVLLQKDYQRNSYRYPVITISRSYLKTYFEPVFIAQRIMEETNIILYRTGNFLRYKRIALAGYGVIGRQLALQYRNNNTDVIVIEKSPTIRALSKKEGFKTYSQLSNNIINNTYLYIGVTGYQSFTVKSLTEFIKSEKSEYYLVSGSSKKVEFQEIIDIFETGGKNNFKKVPVLAELKNIKIIHKDIGTEYQFYYKDNKKKLILFAGGVPINFFNSYKISLPTKAIDPIFTLLLLSLIKIKQNRNNLKNKIYFLGSKEGNRLLNINEEEVIKIWYKKNNVDFSRKNLFQMMNPHPLNDFLTRKRITVQF
jgi:S-adenosylhomocysteine hydrolase